MIKQETSAGDKLVLEVEFTGKYRYELPKDDFENHILQAKEIAERSCIEKYGNLPGFRIENTETFKLKPNQNSLQRG